MSTLNKLELINECFTLKIKKKLRKNYAQPAAYETTCSCKKRVINKLLD